MNEYLKKNLGLVMLVAILIAMGLVYWFGIRMMGDVIAHEQNDIQKAIAVRENRERQLGKLQEYQDQYDTILRDEDTLKVFTEKEHMIDFIKQLEGLAQESGVHIVIEAREGAPVKPAAKVAADTDKSDVPDTAAKTNAKKDKSIIGNLPTQEYTRLALRVSGDTKKVIQYIHKVETLPVALDVIALDATRKEREITRVNAPAAAAPVVTPEAMTREGSGLFVAVPETTPTPESITPAAFNLEVVADMIVYHSQ
jgi:hypothetical protein